MKLRRFVEFLTALGMAALLGFVIYFWEDVDRVHRKTRNTLGQVEIQGPGDDLFLWSAFALFFYFGTLFWGRIAEPVFALSPENTARTRTAMQAIRAVAVAILLYRVIQLIARYVPDYLQRLPWF